jgi:hypothetical protein
VTVGADFIQKATPSFKKSWDRARIALGTSDLFTSTPSRAARAAAAEIIGDAQLQVGEDLVVRPEGKTLMAYRGNTKVARFIDPPADICDAVAASSHIARGTVVEVHTIAGMVEIAPC